MNAPLNTKQALERFPRPSAALSAQFSFFIVVARASFGAGSGRGLRA